VPPLNSIVRRLVMRTFAILLLVVALVACATDRGASRKLGYTVVTHDMDECPQEVPLTRTRAENIVLEPQLSTKLLALVAARNAALPHCWYLEPDGSIRLHAGPFPTPTLIAYFHRKGSTWVLERSYD
jgi:hypothetical protein